MYSSRGGLHGLDHVTIDQIWHEQVQDANLAAAYTVENTASVHDVTGSVHIFWSYIPDRDTQVTKNISLIVEKSPRI